MYSCFAGGVTGSGVTLEMFSPNVDMHCKTYSYAFTVAGIGVFTYCGGGGSGA